MDKNSFLGVVLEHWDYDDPQSDLSIDLWDLIYLERVRFFTVHLAYAELKCEHVHYDKQLKL